VVTDFGHSDFQLALELPHTRLVVRGQHHPYATGDFVVAAARADGAREFQLSIQPRVIGQVLGLAWWRDFGLVDITSTLAQRYRVRTNDRGLARAWLSSEVQARLRTAPTVTARIHRGRVAVSYPGHFAQVAEELDAIVAITEGLCSERASALRGAWHSLAAKLDARVESTEIEARAARLIEVGDVVPRFECTRPPPIHLERSPHQLRIDGIQRTLTGRRRDRSLWTVLRVARRDHGTGRVAIVGRDAPAHARPTGLGRYRAMDLEGARLAVAARASSELEQRCARLAAKQWPALGPDAVVLVDPEVEVLWPGLQTEFGAVEAGVALATELAVSADLQDGPYR